MVVPRACRSCGTALLCYLLHIVTIHNMPLCAGTYVTGNRTIAVCVMADIATDLLQFCVACHCLQCVDVMHANCCLACTALAELLHIVCMS